MLLPNATPPARRAPFARLVSHLFAALAVAGVALLAPACDGEAPPGEECVGGVIVNGVCEGKCEPDKCLPGNTCVGNRCALLCDSHTDCYLDGSQDCLPATEDETDAAITTCQFGPRSAGTGIACPFKVECANWLACPDDGTCFASQCAGDPGACVQDADVCKDDASCVVGKCPDGSGCRVNCAVDCKPWLECQTKGEGDAEAYCTKRDCATDDDCIGGYYCGIIRDPHEVCATDPPKGDNSFCGETTEPCLPPGANGTSLFEGSLCMLRRSCLKRDQSVPCATDLDCSQIEGQKCVAFGGETRCARTCAQNTDCLLDATCDLGLGACVPKFGKWITDGGKFCEPCKNDEDCGGAGTSWTCFDLFGGMGGCFDQSFPDTCTTDADCPKAPGGKAGTCLDEEEGLAPGDSVYHRCYVPINNDGKSTCW